MLKLCANALWTITQHPTDEGVSLFGVSTFVFGGTGGGRFDVIGVSPKPCDHRKAVRNVEKKASTFESYELGKPGGRFEVCRPIRLLILGARP